METIPILLDTDIGSDIDDAVALAYLLRQPRCELLGVTTVTGHPDKRAALADAICSAGGRTDIPIHAGIARPLIVAPKQPEVPHYETLESGRWPHRTYDSGNTAIEFLRQTIRSRPGEITLLAVGPLTNVAVLFAIDPEIPSLLKGMTIMGGRFFGTSGGGQGVAEWNILNDPHAAAMVFAAPIPNFTAVGLDVTLQCSMAAAECRTRFAKAGGPLDAVSDMAVVWFRRSAQSTFHDPLAAALIFEPTLCETVSGNIAVEIVSPLTSGQTVLQGGEEKPHRIAKTVDTDAFFAHYFDIVGG